MLASEFEIHLENFTRYRVTVQHVFASCPFLFFLFVSLLSQIFEGPAESYLSQMIPNNSQRQPGRVAGKRISLRIFGCLSESAEPGAALPRVRVKAAFSLMKN